MCDEALAFNPIGCHHSLITLPDSKHLWSNCVGSSFGGTLTTTEITDGSGFEAALFLAAPAASALDGSA